MITSDFEFKKLVLSGILVILAILLDSLAVPNGDQQLSKEFVQDVDNYLKREKNK